MTVAVVNAVSLGVSEWDLAWLDAVEFGGAVYGLAAAGIYRLAGADDDGVPVAAFVETGDLELTPGASINVAEAHLSVAAEGLLTLTATADQDGLERTVVYAVPTSCPDKARVKRMRLGRGVMGNAWRFRLGVEASAWELSGWQIGLERMRRR